MIKYATIFPKGHKCSYFWPTSRTWTVHEHGYINMGTLSIKNTNLKQILARPELCTINGAKQLAAAEVENRKIYSWNQRDVIFNAHLFTAADQQLF